jgi:hypothetical protein
MEHVLSPHINSRLLCERSLLSSGSGTLELLLRVAVIPQQWRRVLEDVMGVFLFDKRDMKMMWMGKIDC